jgi:hypothetical protein
MKIKDLNKYKDVESELLKILSEELARNIDREIIKSLGVEMRIDKYKRILDKIRASE